MPWTNMGPNGELAAPNPQAAFFRSMGLNDDGTQPGTNVPATGAPPLPDRIPAMTVGNRPRPAVPTPPAAQGAMPQSDPMGTIFPERDAQAYQQFMQGTGSLPPSMAVPAAPGQSLPAGARELNTNGAGRFFVDGAANPAPAAAPSLSGMALPSFDQFRAANMNSGIGANTPALMNAYLQLQNRASGIENTRGTLANNTLEANTRWGPNGLGQQDTTLRQGELALNAAQAQLRTTSWARRAETERGLIAAGMTPEAAARRVQEMERSGTFNGPSIDMTQIPGLPGYVPSSPTGPASPLPVTPPATSAAPAGGGPATPATTAAGPRSLIVSPPAPTVPPPPGPVYENLQRQVEAQFPTSDPRAQSPGALVFRLQQSFPQLFANTPEGLKNREAIFPYLNARFNPQDVSRSAQGTTQSFFGAVPRSDLGGLFGFMPAVGRAAGWLADGGQNMNPDLEGRALMQSMRQGRW